MKLALRGASGVALLVGLSGFQTAAAQQTPTNPNQTVTTTQQAGQPSGPQTAPPAQTEGAAAAQAGEKVTITGSLIATAAEDAPKPVEVFTKQDLQDIGSPSVAEFIRDLSISFDSDIGGLESSGDGVGETTGYAPANLRGLGDTGTLTLLNGRRLSTDNGTGADLNTIPTNALCGVEVLRDGASTTYGAGAVGGVINLRTCRDVEGPTVTVRHEMYDKSAGDWSLEAATGWVGDAGNVLVTYTYDKSAELRYNERDFSSLPFSVNPTGYTLDNGSYSLIEDHLYTSGTPFITVGTPACVSLITGPVSAGCQPNTGVAGALPVVAGAPQTTNAANFWLPGGATAYTDPRRRIMDFTPSQCLNAGGDPIQDILPGARFSTTAGPVARLNNGCALPLANIYSLVNEDESHRAFAEINLDVNDHMEVSANILYSSLSSVGADAPSEQVSNGATIPFGVSPLAPQQNSTTCSTGCGYMIPINTPVYNATGTAITGSVRNPYVNDFLTRSGLNPASYGLGDGLYVGPGWRPILWGGNSMSDDGRNKGHVQRERLALATEAKGQFTEGGLLGFLNGINYNYSAQFNKQQTTTKENYLLGSRLQNALMGYGGPSCGAVDRVATNYGAVPAALTTTNSQAANSDRARFNSTIGTQSNTAPGTDGCFFFNPFNSSWQTSLINGADNSVAHGGIYGGAAYENSPELVRWLFEERTVETIREALIFDTTWSGEVPFYELPGGPIAWAGGLNWRQTEYRQLPSGDTTQTALAQQPCLFPDVAAGSVRRATGEPLQYVGAAGCATATGPFTTTSRYLSRTSDEQTFDVYGQLDLPVLDTLNFQASWRHTSLNGDKISGDIWNVAGKYDILDNLYVRASYGTNFRAVTELNLRPGSIEFGGTLSGTTWGRVGNVAPQSFNIVDEALNPEDDRNLNLGIGYTNDDLLGGRFRATVDFFEIGLYNQVVGGSAATLLTPSLDQVFRNTDGSVTVGTAAFEAAVANCSAPAAKFFGFNTPDGTCQAGVTGADMRQFFAYTSNGGGFITNGIDYAVNYTMPLFDGRFSADLRATQTLVYKDKGTRVAGVELETPASQIGLTGGNGANRSADWRGTATLRYSNTEHTFTVRTVYESGSWLRGYLACLPPNFNPATNAQLSTVGGTSSCGTGLTAVRLNTATGTSLDDPTNGAVQFSDYGVRPEERITVDLNYIYTPKWLEGFEFGATVENLFDEDPYGSQVSNRGYVGGNPRGRILQLQITKRY
ncbi:MAG TPA: TonB-dependent receptor [Hyphomonadaceae bacterium]|nr:TonB-dependent receptor [Hyphomonadaceae bacterium]